MAGDEKITRLYSRNLLVFPPNRKKLMYIQKQVKISNKYQKTCFKLGGKIKPQIDEQFNFIVINKIVLTA